MTDLELAMKLAELRARAARNCGLSQYPGKLIRLSERLDRWTTVVRGPNERHRNDLVEAYEAERAKL